MRKLLACLLLPLALGACDQIREMQAKQRAEASQGGAFLLLEVDADSLRRAELENIADEIAEALRTASPAIRVSGRGVLGDAARISLADSADAQRATAIAAPLREGVLSITSGGDPGVIEARLTEEFVDRMVVQARVQTVSVLARRFPMNDVMVETSGRWRILLHAGPRHPDPAEFMRGLAPAQFTFHLVREIDPTDLEAGLLPAGTMLAPPFPDVGFKAEAVVREPAFTGERLQQANPSVDSQTGQAVLSFQLDAEGTRTFCRITTRNTGTRFAILYDGQVLTAPTINEPICGGAGQISGNFTMESVNELAAFLRSGALPAPLRIIEQGTNYRPSSSTAASPARSD
jgi:preprotein translocase subunit SecD